jgi:hypothetical protein
MGRKGPQPQFTEESRRAARETRRLRSERVNMKSLVRRDREPGEVPTRTLAIQNFCRSCLGFEADDGKTLRQSVLDCESQTCWLWPYRASRAGGDE